MRHPAWRRTSVIWSRAAFAAAVAVELFTLSRADVHLVKDGAGRVAPWVWAALLALLLVPALPLVLQARWWAYRAAVVASALVLSAAGLFVSFLFLPAAAFAWWATGTEGLSRAAV
jgi:hypothetical protein